MKWTLGLLCAAVLLCGATVTSARQQVSPAGRQLVIPFENANREPRVHWLTEGSAVLLTDDLLALGVQAISRDDRLRAFERLRVPPVATLSHATVIRLGQVVGASQVIVGTFEVSGDELIVRARAIRLDSGRMADELVERGPLADMFAVYARVARRLVQNPAVTAEQMERGHPPLAAFEQYIKGLLAEAPEAKSAFLTQALRLTPSFQRPRIALWQVRTDESNHRSALQVVSDVPGDHRAGRQARFLAGVSLLHLARYQEAFDTFSELNQAARDPALLNNLGIVQLRRAVGAPGGRAVSYFSEAVQIDDTDSDLLFNLGYAYLLGREAAAAIQWLREAVRRNPADDAAHYVLGVALQAVGNTGEGAREKELAKRLSSEYAAIEAKQTPSILVPRGLERLKTEVDVPAALRVDSIIVAAGQRDQRDLAAFHLDAGRRAYAEERDVEAIAELRRAVYLSPYLSEAHLLLGRVYLRVGRLAEAIDSLTISIWSEDSVAARLALVEAHIQAGDAAAARSELQAVNRLDPGNVEAKRLLDQLP